MKLQIEKFAVFTATFLAIAASAFAQNSVSQGVTVEATVIQGLSITVSGGPLNFGSVVAGTTPAAINAQSSPVMFTISGNGSSAVKVTYASATLNGPGSNMLNFAPSVYGASSSGSQGTSTQVSTGSTVTLSGLNASPGNYYLWLGGDLGTIPSNQAPGSYSGTFTLTVSY